MTPGRETRGAVLARWRVRMSYPVALACLLPAHPTPASLVTGAAVAGMGLVVRGAAAGHVRKGQQLATSGPYGFTRNPLYFGSMLVAAGFLIAAHSWIATAGVAAYFAVFYPPVMRGEEQELRGAYGAEFEDYAARVPGFWPRWTRGVPRGQPFSWAVYRQNREYEAVLGYLLGIALLSLVMHWRR